MKNEEYKLHVHPRPKNVHELKEKIESMLADLKHELAIETLNSNQVRWTKILSEAYGRVGKLSAAQYETLANIHEQVMA